MGSCLFQNWFQSNAGDLWNIFVFFITWQRHTKRCQVFFRAGIIYDSLCLYVVLTKFHVQLFVLWPLTSKVRLSLEDQKIVSKVDGCIWAIRFNAPLLWSNYWPCFNFVHLLVELLYDLHCTNNLKKRILFRVPWNYPTLNMEPKSEHPINITLILLIYWAILNFQMKNYRLLKIIYFQNNACFDDF